MVRNAQPSRRFAAERRRCRSQPRNSAWCLSEAAIRHFMAGQATAKYRRWKNSATLTRPIITGTSTSGPMTAANAAPELMP